MASSLHSWSFITFLSSKEIQSHSYLAKINKKDIIKIAATKSICDIVVLSFEVLPSKEASEYEESNSVEMFSAKIIYYLLDKYS